MLLHTILMPEKVFFVGLLKIVTGLGFNSGQNLHPTIQNLELFNV